LVLGDFEKSPRSVAHGPPMIESPAYDANPQPCAEDSIADSVYPMDACF